MHDLIGLIGRYAIPHLHFKPTKMNPMYAQAHHYQIQDITLFLDADQELFEECLTKFQEKKANERELQDKRELIWKRLEEIAASKAVSNEAVLVSRVRSSLTIPSTSPRSPIST